MSVKTIVQKLEAIGEETKAALAKIPINITSVEQALTFAEKLGFVPPIVVDTVEEAAVFGGKVVEALKATNAITDEASAQADLVKLLTDIVGPEAEAQQAADGLDTQ